MKNFMILFAISSSFALTACTGTVSGRAFMQGDSSQGIQGVTMLFEKDGTTQQEQATTGPGGGYSLTLDKGAHNLRVIHPVYSECSPDNPNLVIVQAAQNITVDAILCE